MTVPMYVLVNETTFEMTCDRTMYALRNDLEDIMTRREKWSMFTYKLNELDCWYVLNTIRAKRRELEAQQ